MRIVFLLLVCWGCVRPVFAADSCNAGYFVNDMGECEICSGGYYCADGVDRSGCANLGLRFEEYEKIGVVGITGATTVWECGVSYVPAGYMVRGDGDVGMYIEPCSGGGYCPEIDYDVRIEDVNAGFGIIVGRIPCGFAYSAAGSDSADDCVPCPEYGDMDYHFAGIVMFDTGGSVETCGAQLLFGGQDVVTMYGVVFSMLMGQEIALSPSYLPQHINNTRGVSLVVVEYDVGQGRYVVNPDESQVFACGAGYFAPLVSEQWPDGFVLPDEEPQTVQDVIELCAPVGKNAYSSGYELDMNTMSLVDDGMAWYACPDGTYSAGYGVGADDVSDCCVAGYRSHNGVCAQMCAVGIEYIKTSTGMSVPLFAEKPSSPALGVGYNGGVCYAGMATGVQSGAINVRYNGHVYHVQE